MRCLATLALAILMCSGCAQSRSTVLPTAAKPATPATASPVPADPPPKLIVTPEIMLTGKVVRFNAEGRFVVLNFPIGHLPVSDQRLFVYRQGLKVGEVRVTGPQRDDNTVADVLAGEALPGDEVRDK